MNDFLRKNQIQLLWIGKFESPSENWVHMTRDLHEYELILVEEGVLYIGDGFNEYEVQKGQYLLMPPTRNQHGTNPSFCSFHWIHFKCDKPLPMLHQGQILDWDSLLSVITEIYRSEKKNQPAKSERLLEALLLDLWYQQHDNGYIDTLPNRICQKIYRYVDWNKNTLIKVSDIANYLGYNDKYLSTLFFEETASHLKKYLIKCQIENAKNLLLCTDLSIQQIAYACGYSDPHNFSRTIKKETGMSPKELRKHFNKE